MSEVTGLVDRYQRDNLHLVHGVEELLDSRNRMTRRALGAEPASASVDLELDAEAGPHGAVPDRTR